MYEPSSTEIEIIPWNEFQTAIAPMWGVEDASSIPIINNPYRVIEYPLERWRDSILHYPIRYSEDGVVKGYTCVYNVNQSTVRIRGIYILEEFRGVGAGLRMTKKAMELFPTGFNRMVGFFKETTYERFVRHGHFEPIPTVDWLWSSFQNMRVRALYWDRWPRLRPSVAQAMFIDSQLDQHGIGGTNNLNQTWTDAEWIDFATPHAFVYPEVGLNLGF